MRPSGENATDVTSAKASECPKVRTGSPGLASQSFSVILKGREHPGAVGGECNRLHFGSPLRRYA